jgi:hypothetical protein
VTDYWLDCPLKESFSIFHNFHISLGTHPASYKMDKALVLWIKRPELEAYDTPPSSVKLKNGGVIPPVPHIYSRHRA